MKLSDSPPSDAPPVHPTTDDYDIEAHPVIEEQVPRRSRCKPTKESKNVWCLNAFLLTFGLAMFGYIVYSNYGPYISVHFEPHEYLKTDSTLGNSTSEALSASMAYYSRRGSAHHSITCHDTLYGCCLIAYQTANQISHGWLHEISVRGLHPYFSANVKHNPEGSNCPHLTDIVGLMNRAYFPERNGHTNCETSEFGCCQVDITADEASHTSLLQEYGPNPAPGIIHADRSTWADFAPRKLINTAFVKSDATGSGCPTAGQIIDEHNSNYSGAHWASDAMLSIIIFSIIIWFVCAGGNGRGRR